jgi:type IX secretion system PorP/SprF family membrane protein
MRILLLWLAFLVTQSLAAQQMTQYSQYIFNGLAINPAYAGTKSLTSVSSTYRNQWVNIAGAPVSQNVMADGAYSRKAGWGAQVENDRIGAQGRLSVLGTYAYRVYFSSTSRLSFGLSGGVERYSINRGDLTTVDPNDPAVMSLSESKWRPDARFGMFYNTEKFYAGASVANIFSNIAFNDDEMMRIQRHYFLLAGYLFNISENIKLKPSILVKEDFHAPANFDFNAFVLFQERLWTGVSYRTGYARPARRLDNDIVNRDAIVAAAEFYVNPQFRVGYSYDFDIAGLRSYNTHEISLGYYFVKKQYTPMVSPRYF